MLKKLEAAPVRLGSQRAALYTLGRSSAWFVRALAFVAVVYCVGALAQAAEIHLLVDKPLPAVAENALAELRRVLAAQGRVARTLEKKPAGDAPAILVGIAGQSPGVDQALAADSVALPGAPESLAVRRFGTSRSSLLICGRDARGLSYALRDVARSVELAPRDEDPLAHILEEVATATLSVRNVSIHPMNADVERRWYFEEEFWRSYFGMLALHRFNQFTLTFSDQTNYLCPLYAFLLDMPEYPGIHLSEELKQERPKQLAMLRRISELAEAHGIDFNLGIWMQAPVPKYSGAVEVTGLPEGEALAGYCAQGLRRVLEACPSIRGVQLRMNEEAGVAAERQAAFFRPIFESLRATGRPVRLDLRYKGLQPQTTQAALDEKLDVTISTKFWSEHFGLPYHPTAVDTHWRKDRYSFGAMLQQPLATRVVYQLWNVGSQRLTLWGSPEYARRFAESCLLGGGSGFEVLAPLTDQGYGNRPGEWRAIEDPAYRVGKWDQDKYWYFYLCFGRLGFNRETNPEVWRREFRSRFGEAASAVEQAYRAASEVLPMITAARLPGASEWSWWPEMDTGGGLREYMHIQPSDPAQFYAIAQWKRAPGWRWEEWDDAPGFVEDVSAGKVTGKWTPWMIADRLERIAVDIETAWNDGAQRRSATPEWRMTEVDHRVLAELAHYHASKMCAATELAFFESDQQAGRIKLAEAHASSAMEAWKRLVALTDKVYHEDLVFGIAKESPRSKLGHHHSGHWRDRLPEVEADVSYLRDLRIKLEASGPLAAVRRLPLESTNRRSQFRVQEGIAPTWRTDGSVDVRLTATPDESLQHVVLHYRPLDQTRDWRTLELRSANGNIYSATLPAEQIDRRFDWQCYVELLGAEGGVCWPNWEERQPYVVFHPPAR
jgi:hypothetical protein